MNLTAADGRAAPRSRWFYDGVFKVGQTRASSRSPNLTLAEPLELPEGASGRRRGGQEEEARKLWGEGTGNVPHHGQFSSATVRGTRWLVIDRCGGTLTRVTEGTVAVRDFVKRKTRPRQGRQAVPGAQAK